MDLLRGFLPEHDPIQRLPKTYSVWESVAANLPKLLVSDQLRATLSELPKFPSEKLQKSELERAMLIFSFFGHAYIWGVTEIETKLPATLAIPWYQIANRLGRPPVLSYASYALNNWRRLDTQRPVELGNIALLQNFLGGVDEEWFVLVHVQIEAQAATGLKAIKSAQRAVKNDNEEQFVKDLKIMMNSLLAMCETLDRMPERCDPYIYYHRVRPYIHGWKDNPALPNGIVYEGVTAYRGKPQEFRGETGAQSSIIPAFDVALGIHHKDDPLRIYLREMRDYMPPSHRKFLEAVEKGPAIRSYVKSHLQNSLLKTYYNECILLVTRFRETHLSYAGRYIQKQHQDSIANPTATGTGGTPFMIYLKKHRDEARDHLF
jgi:indoleamine 2,3-dioxygenase